MQSWLIPFSYLLAGIFFILAIRSLSSPYTAHRGNIIGMFGMLIAIITTICSPLVDKYLYILVAITCGGIIGIFFAFKVRIASLPQMIAVFNGLGGLAAVFISLSEIINGSHAYFDISIGLIIGALAFSGSMIAFAKLQELLPSGAFVFRYQQQINLFLLLTLITLCIIFLLTPQINLFYWLTAIAIILGFLLVLPIGGADMPVVISVLNSYTGWAAVGIGFSLNNILLIITGSLVGAGGAILSYIMVKAMNRSLTNVLLGGFGQKVNSTTSAEKNKKVNIGSAQDAAYIMENAHKVIIVPGYGMAVAQAQYVLQKMAEDLRTLYNVDVKFAIHPVAGRMPGHMNVLLAEANIPYEDVFALEDINHEFASADVAYVIGANDITNPLAKTDSSSPIYGMPILDVEKAKIVFFVKRSLASGYSGIENPLFFANNTIMLYGDAKQVTEEIVNTLEQNNL
ncbi:MAG: NAD(P)(+) transhydrogenase (Re/Si-specific) subunit beta [Alphaproteobacteria bacterium]|nr:NAD(P)(+) transhydrogenase (Re/Si-specific) subunit beta [Alphaproteobacteria bacterium]